MNQTVNNDTKLHVQMLLDGVNGLLGNIEKQVTDNFSKMSKGDAEAFVNALNSSGVNQKVDELKQTLQTMKSEFKFD